MDLKQTLQGLEQRLLTDAVRHNEREVALLLADEFREFGSSGRIFSKTEVLALMQSEPSGCFSLKDFAAYPISEQAVLVTFRAVKEGAGSLPTESLRSSLWVHRDGRWQMLFHQGTRISQ